LNHGAVSGTALSMHALSFDAILQQRRAHVSPRRNIKTRQRLARLHQRRR
jgi:hypothetical protein